MNSLRFLSIAFLLFMSIPSFLQGAESKEQEKPTKPNPYKEHIQKTAEQVDLAREAIEELSKKGAEYAQYVPENVKQATQKFIEAGSSFITRTWLEKEEELPPTCSDKMKACGSRTLAGLKKAGTHTKVFFTTSVAPRVAKAADQTQHWTRTTAWPYTKEKSKQFYDWSKTTALPAAMTLAEGVNTWMIRLYTNWTQTAPQRAMPTPQNSPLALTDGKPTTQTETNTQEHTTEHNKDQ